MAYDGRCELNWSLEVGLQIDHADPQVRISAELLAKLRAGRLRPEIRLDGDLLRIAGTNRTVIYRLGGPTPDGSAYYMAWPD